MERIEVTDADIDALARMVESEVGHFDNRYGIAELYAAAEAIVETTLNRVAADSWYGKDIQSVIDKDKQYSGVTAVGGWENLPPASPEVKAAVQAAVSNSVQGAPSTIGDARTFLNPDISSPPYEPEVKKNQVAEFGLTGDRHIHGNTDIEKATPLPAYDVVWAGQESSPTKQTIGTLYGSPEARPSMRQEERDVAAGMKGRDVKSLQQALSDAGYNVGVIDGIFGDQTQRALEAFQATAGIDVTGVYDAPTQEALTGQPDLGIYDAMTSGPSLYAPEQDLANASLGLYGELMGGQPTPTTTQGALPAATDVSTEEDIPGSLAPGMDLASAMRAYDLGMGQPIGTTSGAYDQSFGENNVIPGEPDIASLSLQDFGSLVPPDTAVAPTATAERFQTADKKADKLTPTEAAPKTNPPLDTKTASSAVDTGTVAPAAASPLTEMPSEVIDPDSTAAPRDMLSGLPTAAGSYEAGPAMENAMTGWELGNAMPTSSELGLAWNPVEIPGTPNVAALSMQDFGTLSPSLAEVAAATPAPTAPEPGPTVTNTTEVQGDISAPTVDVVPNAVPSPATADPAVVATNSGLMNTSPVVSAETAAPAPAAVSTPTVAEPSPAGQSLQELPTVNIPDTPVAATPTVTAVETPTPAAVETTAAPATVETAAAPAKDTTKDKAKGLLSNDTAKTGVVGALAGGLLGGPLGAAVGGIGGAGLSLLDVGSLFGGSSDDASSSTSSLGIVDLALAAATGTDGSVDSGKFWDAYYSLEGSGYGPNLAQASYEMGDKAKAGSGLY